MMNENFLTKDALFHNRTETMSIEQQCRFDTMLLINHIINCSLTDDRERSSGKCLYIQFTYFLSRLRNAFETTIRQYNSCSNIMIFDDFIRIADYCFEATKEIVARPSTHIEKVDTKMLANKVNGFGTKTMRWMAQRPGRTIREKIPADNKVLTSKTVFSTDTKENREFMYLYRILYDAVTERSNDTNCRHCNKRDGCGYYNWVSKMQRLLALNMKIKNGELGVVKPVKQTFQNNKLMCDKNYKIIWDAVMMLSHVEEKIVADYNSNLKNRLATVFYWLILAKFIELPDVVLEDSAGVLIDEDGTIAFGNENDRRPMQDDIIVKTSDEKLVTCLTIQLSGLVIIIKEHEKILFTFDIDQYFQLIENMTNDSLSEIDRLKNVEWVKNNSLATDESYICEDIVMEQYYSVQASQGQTADNTDTTLPGEYLLKTMQVIISVTNRSIEYKQTDGTSGRKEKNMDPTEYSEIVRVLAMELSLIDALYNGDRDRIELTDVFKNILNKMKEQLETEDRSLLSLIENDSLGIYKAVSYLQGLSSMDNNDITEKG